MTKIKIKLHYENMPRPFKNHADDVGLDLTVMGWERVRERVFLLDTGVSAEAPKGYFLELHARSSIFKYDFIMANSVGIIDPGYRGKLFMPVRYLGCEKDERAVERLIGCRLCQLVLRKAESIDYSIVRELGNSQRSEKGLGSSGV